MRSLFPTVSVRRTLSLVILASLILFLLAPSVSLAVTQTESSGQGFSSIGSGGSSAGGSSAAGTGLLSTPNPDSAAQCITWPYSGPCQATILGVPAGGGICVANGVCQATWTLGINGTIIGAGLGVVANIITGAISNAMRPNTSGGINISTGQTGCPSGRYPVSDVSRLSEPCAYYVPPTTTPPDGCDLYRMALGLCEDPTTTPANDKTNASLSVTPNSGAVPLPVTFTVTDTSTGCPKSPIILSSGDGTAPITAFGATNSCAARAPAVFNYTYGTAGTFQATVKNQTTQSILQSATVSVTGEATATDASLTVTPNSGSAPLPVTFTVTDTSTGCPRAPIALSSGDGAASIVAFPATNSCAARAPAVFNYTYGTAGTFQATVKNQTTQSILQSVTVSVTGGATTASAINVSLSVSPSSGTAPLSVTFTVTDTSPPDASPSCRRPAIILSSGDGATSITALPAATCAARTPAVFNYTYGTAGTFQAAVVNQETQKTIQTATIIVAEGAIQSETPVNVSSSLLNLVSNLNTQQTSNTSGASAARPQTVYTQSGNTANIQMTAGGATIISGGVRDATKNTGSSAFFGADTQTGVAAQNLVERMCLVRPWQNPLIASRIQSSIFDGLCSGKGFRAGVTAEASPAPASKPAVQPVSNQTPAASSSPAVPPAAAIWATPASVPLGSRTAIFWNSKGVASCIVTSPDGSFNDRRLSGSASTVPLTGATVFSISCLTQDGSPVTNYVKVNISS